PRRRRSAPRGGGGGLREAGAGTPLSSPPPRTALGLPLVVAGHGRCGGSLGQDEQDVVQAVTVERAGEVEEAAPLLAAAQGVNLVSDAGVKRLGLLAALPCGHLSGLACHGLHLPG